MNFSGGLLVVVEPAAAHRVPGAVLQPAVGFVMMASSACKCLRAAFLPGALTRGGLGLGLGLGLSSAAAGREKRLRAAPGRARRKGGRKRVCGAAAGPKPGVVQLQALREKTGRQGSLSGAARGSEAGLRPPLPGQEAARPLLADPRGSPPNPPAGGSAFPSPRWALPGSGAAAPSPSRPCWPRRVTNGRHMTVTPNGGGRAEPGAGRGRSSAQLGGGGVGRCWGQQQQRAVAVATATTAGGQRPQDAAHPVPEALQQEARARLPRQGREGRLRLQVRGPGLPPPYPQP